MKKTVLLVLLALFLCGCGEPVVQEKGLSMADAIVIEADDEDTGIGMEYEWLRENGCPDNEGVYDVEMQEIGYDDDGGMYDVLHVICSDETKKAYYFNIDSFFGKWK